MLGWKISNGQRKNKLKGNFWNLKTLTYEFQWWHRSTCWGGIRRGQNRTRRNQDTWNFWAAATEQTTGLITKAWATCQTLRDWAILQPEANSYRLCPWSRNPFLYPWTKGSPPLLFHFLAELLQREERESFESKHIFTQVILQPTQTKIGIVITASLLMSLTKTKEHMCTNLSFRPKWSFRPGLELLPI